MIMTGKPQSFEVGLPVDVAQIKDFEAEVRRNTERVRRGDLPKEGLVFLARDLGRSIIENQHNEIVRTKDTEYQTVSLAITSGSKARRAKIADKLAELQ